MRFRLPGEFQISFNAFQGFKGCSRGLHKLSEVLQGTSTRFREIPGVSAGC